MIVCCFVVKCEMCRMVCCRKLPPLQFEVIRKFAQKKKCEKGIVQDKHAYVASQSILFCILDHIYTSAISAQSNRERRSHKSSSFVNAHAIRHSSGKNSWSRCAALARDGRQQRLHVLGLLMLGAHVWRLLCTRTHQNMHANTRKHRQKGLR